VNCQCCGCPKDQCDCAKSKGWMNGVPLLAHIPCLLAFILSALGIGASFAANIHSFAPILFLVSIGCIVWSLSRWKRMNKMNRIVSVCVAVLVLVLWYPHRQHIAPWTNGEHHEHSQHNHKSH
jgi:hypothetical protein